MTRYVSLLLLLLLLPVTASAAQRLVVPVWPHLKVPQNQRISLSFYPVGRGRHIRGPIRWPTLRVYLPPAKKANGCALVICPGGAYVEEAIGLEGYRVARWFNKLGVSCFVLKYRLPDGKLPPSGVPWPLQDVRRAVQIVRANAKHWHINPQRVGVMGFSAGGSVASLAGVHWLPGNPDAANKLNRFSTRPDFLVLGYPVISMMPGITHPLSHASFLGKHAPLDADEYFSSELNVTALTPPTFMFYAHDDHAVNHQNEKRFYAALKRNGIPAKLIEFKHGGHGFGLGKKGTDSVQWPRDCAALMKARGLLPEQQPQAVGR